MLRHRIFRIRNILAAIAVLVLHNEFLVYVAVRMFQWRSIPCSTPDVANCTRLLLVADPQLIGVTFDTARYNALAIRDSDRFLAATFAQALAHTRPHIVCFLGDLLDEGSVATDEQFGRYVQRFKRIYEPLPDGVRVLHSAGDNDIGGETPADVVTEEKVRRFGHNFHAADHVDVHNRTRVVNVNLLTQRPPDVRADATPAHMWRVIVTHISLLAYPGFTSERITNSIRPDVVFSAHNHISRTITYPPMHLDTFDDSNVRHFKLREPHTGVQVPPPPQKYLEIAVPTCSYRMGVTRSGFGMAVIENNQLSYTVLWLPNRFTILYSYLFAIGATVLLLIVRWVIQGPVHSNHHLGHITYKRLSAV